MRVPMIETDDGFVPDLPEGFRGRATLTDDGDYLLTPEGGADERIAALEADNADLRSRLDSVAALADKANATAQEVAQAAREPGPKR